MAKKACKNCKLLLEGNECPLCKTSNLVTNWKGRMIFLDVNKSQIAKKLNIKAKGEYAIKVH